MVVVVVDVTDCRSSAVNCLSFDRPAVVFPRRLATNGFAHQQIDVVIIDYRLSYIIGVSAPRCMYL